MKLNISVLSHILSHHGSCKKPVTTVQNGFYENFIEKNGS